MLGRISIAALVVALLPGLAAGGIITTTDSMVMTLDGVFVDHFDSITGEPIFKPSPDLGGTLVATFESKDGVVNLTLENFLKTLEVDGQTYRNSVGGVPGSMSDAAFGWGFNIAPKFFDSAFQQAVLAVNHGYDQATFNLVVTASAGDVPNGMTVNQAAGTSFYPNQLKADGGAYYDLAFSWGNDANGRFVGDQIAFYELSAFWALKDTGGTLADTTVGIVLTHLDFYQFAEAKGGGEWTGTTPPYMTAAHVQSISASEGSTWVNTVGAGSTNPVPEPATLAIWSILGAGAAASAAARRRRKGWSDQARRQIRQIIGG